jgi:hypothetical protein
MRQIVLLTLFAAAVIAADATGTWTGVLTPRGKESGPAHLILKQDGAKLTGTAGPNEGKQHPIENGKVENGNITFEVPTGDAVMKFNLKHDGDEIKGDVTREGESGTDTATLAVKREK